MPPGERGQAPACGQPLGGGWGSWVWGGSGHGKVKGFAKPLGGLSPVQAPGGWYQNRRPCTRDSPRPKECREGVLWLEM